MSPLSSDLLSAYLDGELSPAETAEMQRQLEADPQLQAELEALRRISLRVRSLPRPPAPAGFAASVLERLAPVAETPVRPAAPKRRWGHWVSGLSTLAAVVLVMVSVLRNTQQDAVPVTMGSAIDDLTLLGGGGGGHPDATGLMVANDSMAGDEWVQNGYFYTQILPSGRIPEAGELLTHLDEVADQPVIVEYTVADVNEAFGEFQVLLLNNSIQAVNTTQLNGDITLADTPASPQSPKLLALYIEADAENLGRALNSFRNTSDVMACTSPQAPEVNADYDLKAQTVSFQQLSEYGNRQQYVAESAEGLAMKSVSPISEVPRREVPVIQPPPAPAAYPVVPVDADGTGVPRGLAMRSAPVPAAPAATPPLRAKEGELREEKMAKQQPGFAGGGQLADKNQGAVFTDPAPADRMLHEAMTDRETLESAPAQMINGSVVSRHKYMLPMQNGQAPGLNFQTVVNTPEQLRSALTSRDAQQGYRYVVPRGSIDETEQLEQRMARSRMDGSNQPAANVDSFDASPNVYAEFQRQAGNSAEMNQLSLEAGTRPLRRAIIFIGCPSHTVPPPVPPPPASPEWLEP